MGALLFQGCSDAHFSLSLSMIAVLHSLSSSSLLRFSITVAFIKGVFYYYLFYFEFYNKEFQFNSVPFFFPLTLQSLKSKNSNDYT